MSDIGVKGLAELGAFLQQLPEKLQKNVVAGALRAGAEIVQQEAQALVPVETGELREGIKLGSKRTATTVIARVRVTGKHAFAAYWLEFTGATQHIIKARRVKFLAFDGHVVKQVQHHGFAAKPFLRPALQAKADEAIQAAADYMKTRLATKYGLDTADVSVEVDAS